MSFIYQGNNIAPKDITTVIIDESVTYIKVHAFQNCTNIKSITIPPSVTHIGDYAFEGCTSLISVNLYSCQNNGKLTYIGDHVFQGCKSLLYINIPSSITFVGDHTFYSCDTLLSRINNYRDIFGLIKDRYNALSLHDICSSMNVSVDSIIKTIEKIRNEHYQQHDSENNSKNDESSYYIQPTVDKWGFNPIHVLCCNSKATSEMIDILVHNMDQSATIMSTSNGKTPLQLYIECHQDSIFELPLCLALKMGMKWIDVNKMILNNTINSLEQDQKDERTSLYPYMLAAIHPHCDLECLYHLALYNVNNLNPSSI